MTQRRFSWLGVWRYVLLAGMGLAQALSLAWPWGGQGRAWGGLQLLALAAGLALLAGSHSTLGLRARFWQGFCRGWCFATAWLVGVFWWLYISMHTYGGLPAWLAALAVLLLAGFLALYYALAWGLWQAGRTRMGAAWQVLFFGALWLLAELCRGVIFTGFPWGAIGYAHVDTPLAGYAPWLGVYGISALAACLSALLWQVGGLLLGLRSGVSQAHARQKISHRVQALCLIAGMVGAVLLIGAWQKDTQIQAHAAQASRPPLTVALLQGNIPQEEKFIPNGGVQTALDWYGAQMQAEQADLVVLPETALPLPPDYLPEGYWQNIQQRFASGGQAVLLGLPAGNRHIGFANAVVGMVPGGARTAGGNAQPDLALPPASQAEYRYAKHHLVPFGEFIPWGFGWFVRMMHIPLGDFQRGQLAQPRLVVQGERIQPNICYEDLFGEELAAGFADPATAPTLLVNVSNIAWFGNTVAIDQHRHISRMRSMELARPMLRATNTGSTAVIDATGHVTHEWPHHARGVLRASVQGSDAPITFFAQWASRWGLWPLWLLGAGLALAAAAQIRKKPV